MNRGERQKDGNNGSHLFRNVSGNFDSKKFKSSGGMISVVTIAAGAIVTTGGHFRRGS